MQPVLEAVARYVVHNGYGEVVTEEDLLPRSCPLAVKTEGALAFFRTTSSERLVGDWRQAQTEIARLPAEPTPVRSLYLTLLVTDSLETQPAWQDVVRDLHVCRKLVVATAGEEVDDWLDGLPFIPIPEQYVRPQRVITPAQALFAANFAPSLAEALLGRVGQDEIARRFLEGRVHRTERMKTPDVPGLPDRVEGRRLDRLELRNFRPFGGVHQVDLSGDLTVIYGPNGTGKSSLTQAIEWGITGAVEHLEVPHDDVGPKPASPYVNVRNPDLPAMVRMTFEDESGARHLLERSIDRHSRSDRRWGPLTTGPDGQEVWAPAPIGQGDILKAVLNASLPRSLGAATLRAMARGAHFLDQSTIRMFLSTSAADRFGAMANMAGTADFERAALKLDGVVHSLMIQLRKAQADLNVRQNEYRSAEEQVRRFRQEVDKSEGDLAHLGANEIVGEAQRLAGDLELPVPATLPEHASGLVSFASMLQGAAQSKGVALAERVKALDQLLEDHERLSDANEKAEVAREERQALAPHLKTLVDQLEHVRGRARSSSTAYTANLERWVELNEAARVAQRNLDAAQSLWEAGMQMLRARESHRETAEALKQMDAEVARREETARQAEAHRDRLDTHQRQLARRRSVLVTLRASHPDFREAIARVESAQLEQQTYEMQRVKLRERRVQVGGQLSAAQRELDDAAALLKRLSSRAQERQRLLTALAGYLEGSSCPLCGHNWGTASELHDQVQIALKEAPAELAWAQQQVETTTRRTEELNQALHSATAELARLEQTLDVLRRQENAARQMISRWLSDAGLFGKVPTPYKVATGPWLDQLEGALAAEDRTGELSEAQRAAQEAHDAVQSAAKAVSERRAQALRMTQDVEEAERRYRTVEPLAPAEVTRPVPGEAELSRLETVAQQAGIRLTEVSSAVHRSKEALEEDRAAEATAATAWREPYERDSLLSTIMQSATRLADSHHSKAAGLGVTPEEGAIRAARDSARRQTDLVRRLHELAEMLLAAANLQALRNELATVERERDAREVAVEKVLETIRHFDRAIGTAREAAAALKQARIEEQKRRLDVYQPTINEVYRRINPHPYFSHLNLHTDVAKGEVVLHASEPGSGLALPVQRYFSMAQENVVALSVFLGTALLQTWSGLKLISIDDPIQQMDDLNTTAFLDVLHAVVRRGHQVVVTTSNKDFYRLMLRRYAYLNVSKTGRFRAFRLRSVNVVSGPSLADDTPVVLADGRVRLGEAPMAH